jgi:hypothetical protein
MRPCHNRRWSDSARRTQRCRGGGPPCPHGAPTAPKFGNPWPDDLKACARLRSARATTVVDADHPELARVAAKSRPCCLVSNRCGAGNDYHDPAWLHPTADFAGRRATYDNGQAHLPRRSCRHDNLAFISQTCHEPLRRTKTSAFEQRTFSSKSWNAHLVFIPGAKSQHALATNTNRSRRYIIQDTAAIRGQQPQEIHGVRQAIKPLPRACDSCRPTVPPSIPSKCPSPSSRPFCTPPLGEPSSTSGRPSPTPSQECADYLAAARYDAT